MKNFIDLTGQKFGRWTVLKRGENTKSGQARWVCKCKCGTIKLVISQSLRNGMSPSCGCLSAERFTVHSLSKHPAYESWRKMISRCTNKKCAAYKNYGGRGISVCDEWLDLWNFMEWVFISGFKSGLTIERIDVNKGYSPKNCKWIPRNEQQKNKRDNIFITNKNTNERLCSSEWSKRLGGERHLVVQRLNHGWPSDLAITIPKGGKLKDYQS